MGDTMALYQELSSCTTPLFRGGVNISAQWLIGRFVRVLHSKSDLINCAGVGRRTLLTICEFCPTPIKGYLLGDAMDIPTPKQDVAGWYADDFSAWKKLR